MRDRASDRSDSATLTELLGELARSINTSLDLDAILQTVAEGARELCRSDLSAIALREPDTGAVVFRYRAGDRLHDDERRVVLPGRGAGGLVLETGRPVRSDEMPEADGYAFIRGVRTLPAEQGGAVPAVAITAHGSRQDRLNALQAGFQMHVPKPVEPAELIAVVAQAVHAGHGGPDMAPKPPSARGAPAEP